MGLVRSLALRAQATTTNAQQFVELRDWNMPVQVKKISFSRHINELMGDYCQFLNAQRIEVDGEDLGHLHLVAKYKDWDEIKKADLSGQKSHRFMSYPLAARERITINGSSLAIQQVNQSILYRHITSRFLYPEDPCDVEGIALTTA